MREPETNEKAQGILRDAASLLRMWADDLEKVATRVPDMTDAEIIDAMRESTALTTRAAEGLRP